MPESKRNNRILIVISQIHKAISHEWVAEELRNRNYDVHFALLNSGDSKSRKMPVVLSISLSTFLTG